MLKTGSYTFHVESYLCDFRGRATLPIIGNFLLQAATVHAGERGFGYEQVSKDNVAWVLSRMSVEMLEYPPFDHSLTVETWVEDVANFYTQRCFRFIGADARVIGYARTVWAAINAQTRRPVNIPLWRPDIADYIVADGDCPIDKAPKLQPADSNAEPVSSYAVRYSDIDINRHINSIKYIEHIINTFDLEMFRNSRISRLDIAYLAEGLFGDSLDIYRREATPLEYMVDTKKGTESVCRSRIVWRMENGE